MMRNRKELVGNPVRGEKLLLLLSSLGTGCGRCFFGKLSKVLSVQVVLGLSTRQMGHACCRTEGRGQTGKAPPQPMPGYGNHK